MVLSFVNCRKIVLALVNGPAIGIGATIVGLCDVAWCSETVGIASNLLWQHDLTDKYHRRPTSTRHSPNWDWCQRAVPPICCPSSWGAQRRRKSCC